MAAHPGGAEVGDNRIGVSEDQERGVRVAAIDDQLHARRPMLQQIAREAAVDGEHQGGLARVDQRSNAAALSSEATCWNTGEPTKWATRSREAALGSSS